MYVYTNMDTHCINTQMYVYGHSLPLARRHTQAEKGKKLWGKNRLHNFAGHGTFFFFFLVA